MSNRNIPELSIFFSLAILCSTTASAVCFKHETYEECLISGLRGTTSNIAAAEIKRACVDKYPSKTKKTLNVTSQEELSKISGTITINDGSVSGTFLNQISSNSSLVRVSIGVYSKNSTSDSYKPIVRQDIDVNINPFSTGTFCVVIDKSIENSIKSNGFKWKILEAKIVQNDN